MSLRRPALLLLALCCAASVRAEDVPTVGSVTKNNGLEKNGRFIVKTPDILRVEPSAPVAPDPRRAIAHYDRVIAIEAAAPEVRAEAMRRAAYLRIELADGGESADPAELRKAVAIYRQLLRELPDDRANDLAVYQLARAYQLLGDNEAAIAELRELDRRYPQSTLVADARFRAAELLYARARYAEAEPLYRAVVAAGASPYFAPARYKLGWSLYQQERYADALPVFLAILDDALPAAADDPRTALALVDRRQAEFAGDALRVSGLSFAALGGGTAMNRYFVQHGEPRFSTLLYRTLAATLLDKRRYTDAAEVDLAFVERHPRHALAPDFEQGAIAALEAGDFTEPAMAAKARYVQHYTPGTAYWTGAAPPEPVLAQLRAHLDALGRYHQARAQALPAGDAQKQPEFLAAADWYRQRLALDPAGAPSTETAMLYADALYDGGRTPDAAAQYMKVAYEQPGPRAAEAAYAAVQAWQRNAQEVAPASRPAALKESIAASEKLAAQFPAHPQRGAVLTRASQDLYEIHEDARAIAVAQGLLDGRPPLTATQRRELLTVLADARYAQKDYAKAEGAYVALLRELPPDEPQRSALGERLATSVYRQAEAARDAGDLRAAAVAFQRVGALVPEASIRTSADYDATAALMALKDWPAAEAALEAFRARSPQSPLLAEADKKLAYAYEQDGKPGLAADAYLRIARRDTEAPDVRRDAAWQAALLYDQGRMSAAAARAYEASVSDFAQPLDRGLQARRRLADIARDTLGDEAAYRRWLQALVELDARAGAARTAHSQQMAAQALLETGRLDAAAARALALSAPVTRSLPRRKQASEAAIASLLRAAQQGDAETTTAATYEIGSVYRDFGRALLDSERPAKLQGEALEQYQILLEEQADPFEEKAISAYEVNLGRLRQGVWNEWVRRSAASLTELAPARYGKHEMRDDHYEALP